MHRKLYERLKETEEKLNLKQSVKASILLEMHYDMQNVFSIYRKELCIEDAVDKTLEHFKLDGESIKELESVYSSPIKKLMETLTNKNSPKLLNITFVLFVIILLGISLPVLSVSDFRKYLGWMSLPVIIGTSVVILSSFLISLNYTFSSMKKAVSNYSYQVLLCFGIFTIIGSGLLWNANLLTSGTGNFVNTVFSAYNPQTSGQEILADSMNLLEWGQQLAAVNIFHIAAFLLLMLSAAAMNYFKDKYISNSFEKLFANN